MTFSPRKVSESRVLESAGVWATGGVPAILARMVRCDETSHHSYIHSEIRMKLCCTFAPFNFNKKENVTVHQYLFCDDDELFESTTQYNNMSFSDLL